MTTTSEENLNFLSLIYSSHICIDHLTITTLVDSAIVIDMDY